VFKKLKISQTTRLFYTLRFRTRWHDNFTVESIRFHYPDIVLTTVGNKKKKKLITIKFKGIALYSIGKYNNTNADCAVC